MNSLISNWIRRLDAAGLDNVEQTATDLTAHVLGCRRLEAGLLTPTAEQSRRLTRLLERVLHGEPAAHLIGTVNFRGLDLRCDGRALIPRPETEWLVEAALDFLRTLPQPDSTPVRIIDVGTGSGCIALALLSEWHSATAMAIDLSSDALALAAENAQRLGLSDRIQFLHGDLLSPLQSAEFAGCRADLITANLPYIRSGDCPSLPRSVREHEPLCALDGGPDGLALIRQLIGQTPPLLRPGGVLFLEIGYDQGDAVAQLLASAGWRDISVRPDLAGHDRIVSARNEVL